VQQWDNIMSKLRNSSWNRGEIIAFRLTADEAKRLERAIRKAKERTRADYLRGVVMAAVSKAEASNGV
jgi:hypothetical protein